MKTLTLQPNQILTTNDFPVHNEQILKIYFKMARHDANIIPPTPLLSIKITGLPLLNDDSEKAHTYNTNLQKYIDEHPEIEYIMCDGSHKTTAITLTHNPIHAVILATDEDVQEFKDKEETGEIFSFAGPFTMNEIYIDKAEHLAQAEFFQTVQSKTDRMVNKNSIPHYMIDHYLNN